MNATIWPHGFPNTFQGQWPERNQKDKRRDDLHDIEEADETDKHPPSSTADDLSVGFHPWHNLQSARWLKVEPAPASHYIQT
jgi:hypothetical protein